MAEPDLFGAFLEYVGTVTPIQALMQRNAVVEKLRAAAEALAGSMTLALPGLDRDALLQLVA